MLELNERNRVYGEEIHAKIESRNTNYSLWVSRRIEDADLKQGVDFFTNLLKSTGGRPKGQIEFTIDAAKEICLLERNEKGKEIRRWLIELSKQHETGKAFTSDQIISLIDLSKCMCLVSIQKEVEHKHFNLYNHPQTWWNYRAALLGYSKETLIDAMRLINKKYKSTRESLLKLDANELIRTGVIDFMLALGKTEEYSKNVGELCYEMSKKMELGKFIWDDTEQDSLGINKPFCNKIKQTYKQISS